MQVRAGLRCIDVELVPANQAAHFGLPEHLRIVDDWVRTRIAAHDPELGRAGDVCPFVGAALRNGTISYALASGADLSALNITAVVGSLGIQFDEICSQSPRPILETLIILFPDMKNEALAPIIFEVHDTLKDSFVRARRMLGEFLPGYDAPGIHNPDFRPLTAPVPLLVIRAMVANDAVFLSDHREWLLAHAKLHASTPYSQPR